MACVDVCIHLYIEPNHLLNHNNNWMLEHMQSQTQAHPWLPVDAVVINKQTDIERAAIEHWIDDVDDDSHSNEWINTQINTIYLYFFLLLPLLRLFFFYVKQQICWISCDGDGCRRRHHRQRMDRCACSCKFQQWKCIQFDCVFIKFASHWFQILIYNHSDATEIKINRRMTNPENACSDWQLWQQERFQKSID